MTKGETLYLGLVIVTFVSFAIMLAYHDFQYRMTRRAGTRTASVDAHSGHGAVGSPG